jgi:hypothetical protein
MIVMASEGTTAQTGGARAPRHPETARRFRGLARWIIPGVILTLLPKCLACVAGYVAAAAGLGLANQELCGGTANTAALLASLGKRTGLSAESAMQLLILAVLPAVVLSCVGARRGVISSRSSAPPVRNEPARSLNH